MKKMIALTAAAAFLAVPVAFAGDDMTFEDIDTNASGTLTMTEVQAVKPDVTSAQFEEYDANDDGSIDMAEYEDWKASKTDDASMDDKGETTAY